MSSFSPTEKTEGNNSERVRIPCGESGRHIYAKGKCQFCGTPESVSLTPEEAQEIVAELSFWGREFEEPIMLKLRLIAETSHD